MENKCFSCDFGLPLMKLTIIGKTYFVCFGNFLHDFAFAIALALAAFKHKTADYNSIVAFINNI